VEEARCMHARFSLFFRLTQIGCRIFRPTEASISCNNLSTATTSEHADSASFPTRLQSIGEGGKLGEPSGGSPDNPGLAVPENPGTGAASLGAAPSWGPAPSTSTLVAPCDVPSAPGIIRASSSHTFDVGSTNVGDSTSATAGRGGLGAAMTWPPALAADDITKGERGNFTGCAIGRRTTRTEEVRLLSFQHHRLKSEHK
jgi:hypothetical protein